MGVIGLILKVLIYTRALRFLWKGLSKQASLYLLYLYAVAFCAIFVVVVAGFTSDVSIFPRLVGWFLFGVVYSFESATVLLHNYSVVPVRNYAT